MDGVLVTGGAGFIGSHVVRTLAGEGVRVRVLDNLSTGSRENLAGLPVEWFVADLEDADSVRAAVRGVERIVHLAAAISVPASLENPVGCYRANVIGSLHVLEAARREQVRRVVLASSCAVYGNQSGPLSEAATSRPVSPYAASKLAMEDLARLYHSAFGLETVCLRLFNVYGPRQSAASAYAAVIPLFIQAALAGRAVMIHGDGHQSRDFVYVDDVVQAVRLASTAPAAGGVFNIGQGSSITILKLVETLRQLVPATTTAFGPPRPGDVRESAADIGGAAESLGYRPAWDLHRGLRATVEWTRASGSTATA